MVSISNRPALLVWVYLYKWKYLNHDVGWVLCMTVSSHLNHLGKCPLEVGGSVGPSGVLWCEGGKTERGRGRWWEGRRTRGVKHQVTVYIPPRRHVAQTEEHQQPSLAEFTRCYYCTCIASVHCQPLFPKYYTTLLLFISSNVSSTPWIIDDSESIHQLIFLSLACFFSVVSEKGQLLMCHYYLCIVKCIRLTVISLCSAKKSTGESDIPCDNT